MMRTPKLASTTPAAARVTEPHVRLALEDVWRSNVTSRPFPIPVIPPSQSTVSVTPSTSTTTTTAVTPSTTHGSTVAPSLPKTTTTSTASPLTLSKPDGRLATDRPALNVSAKVVAVTSTFHTTSTGRKTSKLTTSTSTPTVSSTTAATTTTTSATTTTSRHTTTTTRQSTTTTKTPSTTRQKQTPSPIVPAPNNTLKPHVPQHINDTYVFSDNSSNKTRVNTSSVGVPGLTADSWPLSKLLLSAAVPLLLGLVFLAVTMAIIARCRRRQADGRGSRIKYKRADMNNDSPKNKTKESDLPMLYALVSIGQRNQRSRWTDAEETLPLTQLKLQHNGTWRTGDELTPPPCAITWTKKATEGGDVDTITAKRDVGNVDVGDRIPETIMVENDLYELQDADETDIGRVRGTGVVIDSDSSSDCGDAVCYRAPHVRDDISSLSGEVTLSADGQGSSSEEDPCPVATPLDQEVTWRPFHDYDTVYTPLSDAGAMVRRIDRTGYIKSKLQRNHAYEEVRVDRTADGNAVVIGAMPPCMSASPALPPRRTPAASPALPPRMTPEGSSRRTPSASPALPPRWLPRAMSPVDDDDLMSPPLPPRGSSRTPAADRATPRPPRRSTSVPSSPVAQHPSPPPIPLPPTPPVLLPRPATGRGFEPGQSEHTPDEQLAPDSDTSRSDEEHDYDAVTESPAVIHDDATDHRYSDVDDDGDHRYSASSTDSGSSNRDNVYEQISFEPT